MARSIASHEGGINPVLVDVQSAIDFDDVGISLQVFGKPVMLETPAFEERLLLKCFIPKDSFKFSFTQRGFQHIPVDQPNGFTGFLFCEIVILKGQNVIEQGLVSPSPSPSALKSISVFTGVNHLGRS